MIDQLRALALDWIREYQREASEWHRIIWNYAEPAWQEYRSAAWYVQKLRGEGFEVEEGSGGMPTAFVATYGSGGPTIATYAEYDAVPGTCQKAATYQAPRDGLSRFAAGHTDPHSALGIGALVGALATKAAMERLGVKGTIKFFGEPAEKVCGSKPVHALKGHYDDCDAMISFHPHYMLSLCNTLVWDTHCGSYWSRIYTFESRGVETWPSARGGASVWSSHTIPRPPGAIDAVCLMYTSTKYTKESMLPHTGTWTLNEAILVAGQATADNLTPHVSQIAYAWRAPTLEMQEHIARVLEENARHVAEITHCTVTGRWVTKTRPGLPNHTLADVAYRNLRMTGAPVWGEEAKRYAREIQRNVGLEPMDEPFQDELSEVMDPREAERILRQELPPWQRNYTSDDYTEMTWHTPTVRLYIARPTLKAPPDYVYPEWVMNALGGIPACIDPTILAASRCIANTMLDLMTDADSREQARAEFRDRTGGGIGGSEWIPPLLPPDFTAPIHFRWPGYVSTPRGEEWWIPVDEEGR